MKFDVERGRRSAAEAGTATARPELHTLRDELRAARQAADQARADEECARAEQHRLQTDLPATAHRADLAQGPARLAESGKATGL